ncbi:uncharacterized protein [Onthophagus taurus]|uniref:uncharacterized protein n=1 Tax=Onthophagus taurus TaxID=166361 RepID=UPI0039BE3AAF
MRWESKLRPRNLIVCPVSGSLLLDFFGPSDEFLSIYRCHQQRSIISESNHPLNFVILGIFLNVSSKSLTEEHPAFSSPFVAARPAAREPFPVRDYVVRIALAEDGRYGRSSARGNSSGPCLPSPPH